VTLSDVGDAGTVHASRPNQYKIHFSVLQRKFRTPDDIDDLAEPHRVEAFEQRCNHAAASFDW
jgi:hypothetical protein